MQNYKIEIKWAFIFIGSLLLWMVLERIAGLHDTHIDKHQYITMLYSIIAVLLYYFALRDKRNNFYDGEMTYKQGFMAGLIITLIVTVFSPLTQWIVSYVITPDYFSNVIEYSLESGYHQSLADAEAQFNYKNYALQSTIGAFVMGIITTAIIAIFTKKSKKKDI